MYSETNGSPPISDTSVVEPCPCCGWTPRINTTPEIVFDRERGLIYSKGKRVQLSPAQTGVMMVLIEKWPDLVTREDIEKRIYPLRYRRKISELGDKSPSKFILSHLRIKLRPLGLCLKNSPTRGWWLSREED